MTTNDSLVRRRNRRSLAFRGGAPQGVSLVSIAQRLCALNHITDTQLLQEFGDASVLARQPFDWNHPSGLEGERLLSAAGILQEISQAYTPDSYLNATDPRECVEESYRFCPSCEMSGWHFSMFQLRSLVTCPGHGLALRTGCDRCGIVSRAYTPWDEPSRKCWSCYGEGQQSHDSAAIHALHSKLAIIKEWPSLTQHSHLPLGVSRRFGSEAMRAFIVLKATSVGLSADSKHLGDAAQFTRLSAPIEFRNETARFDLAYLYRTLVTAIEQTIPTLSDGPLPEFCDRIAATAAGGRGPSLLTVEEAAYLAWRGYWEARDHVWQTLDGPHRTRMPHLAYLSIKQELSPIFFVSQSLLLVSTYLEAITARSEQSNCSGKVLSPWEPNESRDLWSFTMAPAGVRIMGWIPSDLFNSSPTVQAVIETCLACLRAWRTDKDVPLGTAYRWSERESMWQPS